jgi:hypothetical protein
MQTDSHGSGIRLNRFGGRPTVFSLRFLFSLCFFLFVCFSIEMNTPGTEVKRFDINVEAGAKPFLSQVT